MFKFNIRHKVASIKSFILYSDTGPDTKIYVYVPIRVIFDSYEIFELIEFCYAPSTFKKNYIGTSNYSPFLYIIKFFKPV